MPALLSFPVRGNAGFRYSTLADPVTVIDVPLNTPLQNVRPIVRMATYAWDSEDLTRRSVVSIEIADPGVREIEATVFLHPDSDELMTMLAHAIRGVVITYYPDMTGSDAYPSILLEVGPYKLDRENDRFYGEWNADLKLRHATGGDYTGILDRRGSL